MFNSTISLIILSGITGGSVYPIIKLAESYAIPTYAYIFWGALLIALTLCVIAFAKGYRAFFSKIEILYYLFCALTNIIIPQSLFFMIAPELPSNVMGLIIILTPVFVYLGLTILKIEQFFMMKWVGVCIGFLGASCLFLPEIFYDSKSFQWQWAALAFLIPLDYAINRIYASKLIPENNNPFRLAIGLFSFVTIISGIIMMINGATYIPFQSLNGGDFALLLHVIVLVLFYLIFFKLAEKGALQNALSSYIVPLVTLAWGVLMFEETVDIFYPFAAGLVFLSLYLTTKPLKSKEN